MLAETERVLNDEIARLSRQVTELQAPEKRLDAYKLSELLRVLRLHGVILLDLTGKEGSPEGLSADYSAEQVQAVLGNLFHLDQAPLPAEARVAVRRAFNDGMAKY